MSLRERKEEIKTESIDTQLSGLANARVEILRSLKELKQKQESSASAEEYGKLFESITNLEDTINNLAEQERKLKAKKNANLLGAPVFMPVEEKYGKPNLNIGTVYCQATKYSTKPPKCLGKLMEEKTAETLDTYIIERIFEDGTRHSYHSGFRSIPSISSIDFYEVVFPDVFPEKTDFPDPFFEKFIAEEHKSLPPLSEEYLSYF